MQFERSGFEYHSGYLHYKGAFVARFKYKGFMTKPKMVKLLLKHYTVEEWFQKAEKMLPFEILRADGLVQYDTLTGFKVVG
jgi:hypothetical protein